MKVSIIIVSFNAPGLLCDCLQSIEDKTTGVEYEIIIVDNRSTDPGMPAALDAAEKKGIKVIRSERQLSFAGANNRGTGEADGDVIVLLNQDTVLKNDAFKALADFIARNPAAGIVGPRLFNADGTKQVSFYSFPTPWKKMMQLVRVNRLALNFAKTFSRIGVLSKCLPSSIAWFIRNFSGSTEVIEVPWMTAACFAYKREIHNTVGFMDEGFEMYCEDMDFCLRVRQKGYKIYFVPEAEAIHYRGWTSGKRSRKVIDWYYKSHDYYYMKHYTGSGKYLLKFLNSLEKLIETI